MKCLYALGEYLFAAVLGAVMFLWLIVSMFFEIPELPRYLHTNRMS